MLIEIFPSLAIDDDNGVGMPGRTPGWLSMVAAYVDSF